MTKLERNQINAQIARKMGEAESLLQDSLRGNLGDGAAVQDRIEALSDEIEALSDRLWEARRAAA